MPIKFHPNGIIKISKAGHVIPIDVILNFFRHYTWWWICMPNLTALAPTVLEIWRGSQNFKS